MAGRDILKRCRQSKEAVPIGAASFFGRLSKQTVLFLINRQKTLIFFSVCCIIMLYFYIYPKVRAKNGFECRTLVLDERDLRIPWCQPGHGARMDRKKKNARHENRQAVEIQDKRSGRLDEIRRCGREIMGRNMDEKRLKAFEDMLAAILKQYDDTTEKMAKLKAEGKEKTVTYRQLFANKLQLQEMLSYYRTYGLLENEK